jgi:hypothetical protein
VREENRQEAIKSLLREKPLKSPWVWRDKDKKKFHNNKKKKIVA